MSIQANINNSNLSVVNLVMLRIEFETSQARTRMLRPQLVVSREAGQGQDDLADDVALQLQSANERTDVEITLNDEHYGIGLGTISLLDTQIDSVVERDQGLEVTQTITSYSSEFLYQPMIGPVVQVMAQQHR